MGFFLFSSFLTCVVSSVIKMDISPKKRSKIVTLSEFTDKNQREIARICGVSQSVVSKILKKKKSTGSVLATRIGKCGRKRKTTARDDKILLRNSKNNPRATSDDLKKDLESAEVHISSSTVRRRLLAAGRKARRPLKKQLLTKKMKTKRYAWALAHKNMTEEDWKKILWSDESHFFVQGQRSQHVRRSNGEELQPGHIEQYVKHPEKIMFWGCFSYFGVGPLKPVSGMMNSVKYIETVTEKVIPTLDSMPVDRPTFQQDSAPCHTSKMCQKFFRENGIQVLNWPGNSPDLNPIENLWSIIKMRLRNRDCTTKQKMIEAVIDLWYHDPKILENCKNLSNSMCKRVKEVIKKRGGHISY